MRQLLLLMVMLGFATAANAQTQPSVEAKSQVAVLVDLSGTWFNDNSKGVDERELKGVAQSLKALLPKLKMPVEIRYFEIGDLSLSQRPLCEARFAPNIFHTTNNPNEFADVDMLSTYFSEDCVKLILLKHPAKFTDITGALNTVSRIQIETGAQYSGLIVLSDFKEELREGQKGKVGPLKGVHSVLLYRVLQEDQLNSNALDARLSKWESTLRSAGASVVALDDVVVQPAELGRLLLK